MPKPIKGYNVRAAVTGREKKSLYHRNLTTSGFMQLQPLFYHECIPFEKVDGQYQIWSRLHPLVLPTMGIVDYHYSKFFVRYKDVWKGWDDFYNRSLHVGSGVQGFILESPYFTMDQMYNLLLDNEFIEVVPSSAPEYDMLYYSNQGGVSVSAGFNWTNKGLPVLKLLQSLGYELSWYKQDPKHYSLLPIYCVGKIYIDHYFPKAYLNNSIAYNINRVFSLDILNNTLAHTDINNAVIAIFNLCTSVCYDNDGFYQAWDAPDGPNLAQTTSPAFNDGFIMGEGISDGNDIDYNGVGVGLHTFSKTPRLTQFGLRALERLSDMMKRYQIAGSSYIQRFLARFGRSITDTHTAIKLGEDVINCKIGDVESNSDSSVTIDNVQFNSVVGDLAGKGVATGTAKISFTNDAHQGMLIGMFSIVPDAGLYQGLDKMNIHTLPEDYWTPEYDQLGPDAINRSEILTSSYGDANALQIDSDVPFGFLPRYYEYCLGRNILSGAFRLKSLGAGALSAYHMYRDLSENAFTPNSIQHGLNFLRGSGKDKEQYNRVFYNKTYNEQFIIRFRAVFTSISDKKSLADCHDWSEDSGKEVQIDANSVTTN